MLDRVVVAFEHGEALVGGWVPDQDVAFGAAGDEDVVAGCCANADDGLDEIGVADEFAGHGAGGDVPAPD